VNVPPRLCECGCSGEIIPQKHHKRYGIPKYLNNHHPGHPLSQKQKDLISKRQRENNVAKRPEVREKMRLAALGKKRGPQSIEHRLHISLSHKGKPRPETTGRKNGSWKGGLSFQDYPVAFNYQFKEGIRKRDNHTCQMCQMSQSSLPEKLHIHHIDYDKLNLLLRNLISLCRRCHTKTNFNRDAWSLFFISIMMKRGLYAEG
jgi:hypothetical protein